MVIHWLVPLWSGLEVRRQVSSCSADPPGPQAGRASF